MNLTENQKHYINKKISDRGVERIANDLSISQDAVIKYLQENGNTSYINVNLKHDDKKITINKFEDSILSLKSLFKENWMTLLILLGLVLITYINSLGNQFVSDDKAILEIKNLGDWGRFLKQPLHWSGELLKTISYKIGGYNPFFYRIFNLIFHLASVTGVFILITLLINTQFAFIISTLFAIHPLNSEAVVWIAGIQYPQSTFLMIWALIFYRFWQLNKQKKELIITAILYLLAISASEKAIVFPFILIAFEMAFGKLKKQWKAIGLFFLVTIIPGIFYFILLGARVEALTNFYYQSQSFINPLIQIPIALTSYWQLLLWPSQLTLYHSEFYFTTLDYVIRLIFTLGMVGLLIYGYKKNRIIFFSIALFIISLIPYLTPLGISWIVAERYVYFGSVGMFCVVGYGFWSLIKNKKTESLGYLIFIIIILLLMVRTIVRNMDWKNEDTLWVATGKTSPSDPKTHNNLGDVYGRQGDLEKSAEEFKIAIKLNPKYADAYHNLGNTYNQMKKVNDAIINYQLAIKYNPNLWQSYQNLAVIYFGQKEFTKAEDMISQAVKINPTEVSLQMNLGVIYLNLGKKELAKKQFEIVLQLDPKNKAAMEGLRLVESK